MARTAKSGLIAGYTPPGLAVGAVVAVHLGALLVGPDIASVGRIVVFEGVAVVCVLGITALGDGIDRSLLVTAVGYAGAIGSVWGLLATSASLWSVTLGMIAGFALLSYGLHRYELITLGLVERTNE